MPIKFLLLEGGFWVFLEGGVEVPILFLWAWGFFRLYLGHTQKMGCDNDTVRAVLSQHLGMFGLPNVVTRAKMQNDKSTQLYALLGVSVQSCGFSRAIPANLPNLNRFAQTRAAGAFKQDTLKSRYV